MKKIVLVTIPMQKGTITKQHYPVSGNKTIEYKGETCFGINSILANKLSKDDDIHFILIKMQDGKGISDGNVALFKEDFASVNEVNAKVTYTEIDTKFEETKEEFQKIYSNILEVFRAEGDDSELYAELTFGTKPSTFMVFSLIQFVERFFDVDVKNIIYTAKDFTNPDSVMAIYEINFLVYLNSITNTMRCESGDKAVENLNRFFGI